MSYPGGERLNMNSVNSWPGANALASHDPQVGKLLRSEQEDAFFFRLPIPLALSFLDGDRIDKRIMFFPVLCL